MLRELPVDAEADAYVLETGVGVLLRQAAAGRLILR